MPICRVLSQHGVKIAPRTCWARKSRPPSRRDVADAVLTEVPAGIYEPDERGRRRPESLYGSLKTWEHLRRQGIVGPVQGGAADEPEPAMAEHDKLSPARHRFAIGHRVMRACSASAVMPMSAITPILNGLALLRRSH